jgi:ArsR family transcriptional regulator
MPEGMPEEVQIIIDIIGNKVRTAVLRYLSEEPRTSIELAELLEVHHASIHRHLVLLEEHGLVVADVERGHRQGKTVLWSTVRGKVEELGQMWVRYATADDAPPAPE